MPTSPRKSGLLTQNVGTLAQQISALQTQNAADLQRDWRRLMRTETPVHLPRDLVIRVIAYRLQEAALGGLPPAIQRKLQTLEREIGKPGLASNRPAPRRLKPGSRLVREWSGKTHIVLVRADGYEYGGKLHPSLSQIAHQITGAHWSGPRFFGLRRPARPSPPGVTKANGS